MDAVTGFRLHRILAVAADAVPVLEGTNARLVVTCTLTPADVGRVAVCQPALTDPDVLVVFGCLADQPRQSDPEAPLVLSVGKASLTLHPDGRIRATGSDIGFDAEAGFAVSAGRIDLN